MFDYLIVGSGLFGAVFSHEVMKRGATCLVLEKRPHIGGNVYTYTDHDIYVHKYGAHIFRTSRKDIWKYMEQFTEFNNFINSPVANYKGHMYNLPFNMNTFARMWDIRTPGEAVSIIEKQRLHFDGEAKNLEQQALRLVGHDIYETLIKGYTEKQ